LENSLRNAYEHGVFVVAAAGNAPEGGSAVNLDVNPRYPVCFDRDSNENFVYGVAATDSIDRKATFSNYGASCVDISAPGERVVSTQVSIDGDENFSEAYGGYYSGTSVAAPLVSGLVALMYSLDKNLTSKQVMNILTETSFDINPFNPDYFGRLGRGRIEAAQAVRKVAERLAGTGEPTVAPVSTASLTPSGSNPNLIVAAPGSGRAPEVRLFTEDGVFVRGFNAFPESFTGGVSLAIGNFDGTSRSSIVTGALAGGGPHVRIFDINTRPIGGFFAYDEAFRGGVSVAAADVTGDGIDEIVTGAGPGGGPHVRIFDKRGQPIGGFFAYDEAFRGGIDVAVGELDGERGAEIVVVPGKGKSEARVYSTKGEFKYSLVPFGDSYRSGMQVDVEDLDGDGVAEIIIRGRASDGTTAAAVYGDGEYLGDGGSVPDISASSSGMTGTVSAAVQRTVWGALKGEAPLVTLTASPTQPELPFYAYETSFAGGVQAGLVRR
jgi:hypothetical protein